MVLHPSLRALPRFFVLGVFCLVGTGTSGYLLYRDMMAEGKAGVGPPIGVIEHCEEDVWRKPSTSYLWADDRHLSYGGQQSLANLAINRIQINPF